jgi:hypothetical protein
MDKASTNPLLLGLFFIIRCLVPLLVMLGISYLLKRLGFIQPPSEPPSGWNNQEDEANNDNHTNSGSLAHGKA